MTSLADLMPLFQRTIRDPHGAAEEVLAEPLPPGVVGMAFALIIIVSSLIYGMGITLSPPDVPDQQSLVSPFAFAMVSGAISLVMAFSVWRVGTALEGAGSFPGSLRLTILLQAVTLAGQLVELVLLVLVPPMASYFTVVLVVWVLWANVNFVAALHGFSLIKALGVLFLAALGAAVMFVVILTMFGFSGGGPV